MFHSEGSPSCVISKTTEVLACQVRAEAVLYLLGFQGFLGITSPLYHRCCAPDVTIRAKFLGVKPCPPQETLETHKSLVYVTFGFFFFFFWLRWVSIAAFGLFSSCDKWGLLSRRSV